MEQEKIESILESLLFVAGEPLPLSRLCELIREAKRAQIKEALAGLQRRWEAPERGLRLVEVAGGWQFQTGEENAPWVGRLLQSRPVRLSRPALECLAIIAYKQPITRVEVDEIRGVDSGGVLKTLLEHGFIKIVGRKDVPGKPLLYATDKRFMEFFRLKSLAELPTLRELEEIQEERLAEARQEGETETEEGEPGGQKSQSAADQQHLPREEEPAARGGEKLEEAAPGEEEAKEEG